MGMMYYIKITVAISHPLFRLSNIGVGDVNSDEEVERITGGTSAIPGEFPWQISMQKLSKSGLMKASHFCGGSILNETHIVTAGHCVDKQDPAKVEIVAGAHRIKDVNEASQQRVKVKAFIPNPAFSM